MTGKELKLLLKSNNIVLSDLANKLGISQQNLSNKMKVKSVTLDFLNQIEEAIGFRLETLTIEGRGTNVPVYNSDMVTKELVEQLAFSRKEKADLLEQLKELQSQLAYMRKENATLQKENAALKNDVQSLKNIQSEYQKLLNSDSYNKVVSGNSK